MPWVKITDQLHENDKILEASGDAVKLWVIGLSWCNFKLTDGHIPLSRAPRLMPMRKPEKVIAEMLERRLWHRAAQICKECVEQRIEKKVLDPVPTSGFYIHNYFGQPGGEAFQRPRWSILAERAAKTEAGRLGGKHSAKQSAEHGAKHGAQAEPPQTPSTVLSTVLEQKGRNAEHGARARTPVPRSPVAQSVSSTYQGGAGGSDDREPPIPEGPRSTGSVEPGARRGGLRHIGAAAGRVARG